MYLRVENVSQLAKLIASNSDVRNTLSLKCDDFKVELKINSTLNDLRHECFHHC